MSDTTAVAATTTRKTIYVSSRKSQLAMVQTNEVIGMLQELYPEMDFVVGQEDTIGDQVLDRHLSELGTSTAAGVFTKSLEEALLARTASFAVHSLKDMPTALPPGLVLGAICKRESPEDAAIIHPKHKQNGILRLKDLPDEVLSVPVRCAVKRFCAASTQLSRSRRFAATSRPVWRSWMNAASTTRSSSLRVASVAADWVTVSTSSSPLTRSDTVLGKEVSASNVVVMTKRHWICSRRSKMNDRRSFAPLSEVCCTTLKGDAKSRWV